MTVGRERLRRDAPFLRASSLLLSLLFFLATIDGSAQVGVDSLFRERPIPDTIIVTPPPTRWDIFVGDLSIIGRDGLDYVTAPARWSSGAWGIAGGVAVGTVGLSFVDSMIASDVQRTEFSPVVKTTMNVGSEYGELVYAQLLTVGLYGSGLAFDHQGIRITGRMLTQALLYSGAVTMGLRYVLGRDRPSGTADPHLFLYFQSSNDHQSFPSGHTTVAFAASSILADRIDNLPVTVFLYSMATLTAVSRVIRNRHWASDVFFGAALGLASGHYVIARQHEREDPEVKKEGFVIRPYPIGLEITMRW